MSGTDAPRDARVPEQAASGTGTDRDRGAPSGYTLYMEEPPLLPEDRARLVQFLTLMDPDHAREVAEYLGVDLEGEPAEGH